MATYEGSQGIAALKAKIKTKSKMLVGESLEKGIVTGKQIGRAHV